MLRFDTKGCSLGEDVADLRFGRVFICIRIKKCEVQKRKCRYKTILRRKSCESQRWTHIMCRLDRTRREKYETSDEKG